MEIRFVRAALLSAALLAAPVAATGQPATESSAGASPNAFRGMWTGWGHANADAMKVEREGVERVREDFTTAGSQRRLQLRNQGRDLGERVGEIVRSGDCAEGERVARAAGDFALVKAVRDHCEAAGASRR